MQPTALSRVFLLVVSFLRYVFSSFISRFSRAVADAQAVSLAIAQEKVE